MTSLEEHCSSILRAKKNWSWKVKGLVALIATSKKKTPKRRKARNSHRNRGFALAEFDNLTNSMFLKMFRIDRLAFDELLDNVDPIIRRNEQQAVNSSGSPISTKTRLAVTLRWLAGGQHIDLIFAWGLIGKDRL